MQQPADWNPGLTVRGAIEIALVPETSSPQMQRLALLVLGGHARREIDFKDSQRADAAAA